MSAFHRTAGLLAAALVAFGGVSRADSTVVVSPANMNGWLATATDGSNTPGTNPYGSADFVNGPLTPPLGVGSLNLSTGDGTNGGDLSAQARYSGATGVLMSSITALGYSTYITSNNGQQAPYLTIYVSTTGGATYDDRFFFEPPYSTGTSPSLGTWATWNPFTSKGWYDDNGTAGSAPGDNSTVTLATLLAALPNARITLAGNGLGGIRLAVGFASDTDVFNTNIDNFQLGVAGVTTTFDFEPGAAVPEPSSIVAGATSLLIGLGAYARRRLRA